MSASRTQTVSVVRSSSVDNTDNIKQNRWHRCQRWHRPNPKILCIIGTLMVLVILALLIIDFDIFGLFKSKNNKNSTNRNKISTSSVLPNTTLEIDIVSNSKTKGSVYYYQDQYQSQQIGIEVQFDFHSFYNTTHKVVSFQMNPEDIVSLPTQYLDLLHHFCGFEIDLINLESNLSDDTNGTEYDRNNDNISQQLVFNMYACDSYYNNDPTVQSVIWNRDSQSSDDNGFDIIVDMVQGKIGQYFVELSILLGSNLYMGNDFKSVGYIANYAIYFWSLCDINQTNCNWDEKVLNNAVALTNQIIDQNGKNHTKISKNNSTNTTNYGMSDDYGSGTKKDENETNADTMRRLMDGWATCNGLPYYHVGDGYCDEDLNTPECGFDGGDCCSNTCKSSKDWLDENGLLYYGYECGSNGYNCLPGCNVDIPNYLGDGYCDKLGGYNTFECNYDNGDCCEQTCNNNIYECGINGYECNEINEDLDEIASWCDRDRCDNECFGMCGRDCLCWKWICGDCYCDSGCSEHDGYCSCNGLSDFWCINVFWVECDNGETAIFGVF